MADQGVARPTDGAHHRRRAGRPARHCNLSLPASSGKIHKRLLTANSVVFERTHDIRRLIRQAIGVLPEFTRFIAAAEILTPYVSAFRYPGLTGQLMPTREEFDEALEHATA